MSLVLFVPKILKGGHLTQMTPLSGGNFYAWAITHNVYQCTTFKACIVYRCRDISRLKYRDFKIWVMG